MIQILGLREFVDKVTGEVRLYDSHFGNGWRAKSIFDLFENLESYIEEIPEAQRFNMFYTTSHCEEKKGRIFISQEVLPIDIDGIDEGTEDEIVEAVLKELKLVPDEVGVVYSGNGIHILIGLITPIVSGKYFDKYRVYYKALCGRINQCLYQNGLRGTADTTVFSAARLLRLPNTANIKPNKDKKQCRLVKRNIVPQALDIVELSDLPRLEQGDAVHLNLLRDKSWPKPDSKTVQEECLFLKHCYSNQEHLAEPQWYAMMSIVGRLENGDKLVHEYSKKYPYYNEEATDRKLAHSLEAAGPRTCANIDTLWDGCGACPHKGNCSTPILLKSKDHIASIDQGFYKIDPKSGKSIPQYEDIVKYFEQQNPFFTQVDSGATFIYNGKYWEIVKDLWLKNYAEHTFSPPPEAPVIPNNFVDKVKRKVVKDLNFTHTEGHLNFNNGVLDLATRTLNSHSKDYGFTYCIPYDYSRGEECPRFDRFMKEITCHNEELEKLLLEYLGYCISGLHPKYVQKCAILYGGGSNGKSVLIELLRSIISRENCSNVNLKRMASVQDRYPMMYKMINISGETPTDSFLDSSDFKSIVAGDEIEVRQLYHNAVSWECTTKLLFACNELPYTRDHSYGLHRRLLIIPFNATFSDELGNKDPMLLDKLIAERSAILQKLLDSFDNFKARGYVFEEPNIVKDQITEYREMSDSCIQFTNEMCEYSMGKQVGARTAYKNYVIWAQENNLTVISYQNFTRRFIKHLQDKDKRITSERLSRGKGKERVYMHLLINAVSNF